MHTLLLALSLPAYALDPVRPAATPAGTCLPPPTEDEAWDLADELDDTAVIDVGGLRPAQIQAGMDDLAPRLLACIPAGRPVVGTLTVALAVDCTGRVLEVQVLDDGELRADVVRCVQDLLPQAVFPHHALPDGFRFDYALQLWYP